MSLSAQFNELKQRVDELGAHMLPAIKQDLTYTDSEYDRVRAYVLLVHAEIESFLEKRIEGEVTSRFKAWETGRHPSVILMGLLAFHKGEWCTAVDSLLCPRHPEKSPKWSERDVDRRLAKCRTQMIASLRGNNGIKACDVLQMLLRLGFRIEDIDDDLISQLDELGEDRGEFAHNSVKAVKTQPDPALTQTRVLGIIEKLEALDEAISELM